MDNMKAKEIFGDEIIGRWPDFEPAGVLLQDWLGLFKKFSADEIIKAVKQYVLNHDAYKKPQLHKFKEVLNSVCGGRRFNRDQPDIFPQYFIQCFNEGQYGHYGTFTQVVPVSNEPARAKRQAEAFRIKHQDLYNGEWRLVICQNTDDISELLKNRAEMMASIKRECKVPKWAGKIEWKKIAERAKDRPVIAAV